MKLSRINYSTAMFFGISSLVLNLILGIFQWVAKDLLVSQGIIFNPLQSLVYVPLISGIVIWILFVIGIWIYNFLAMNGFPISWEVSKK